MKQKHKEIIFFTVIIIVIIAIRILTTQPYL